MEGNFLLGRHAILATIAVVLALVALAVVFVSAPASILQASDNVCPEGDGWVKIDSGDLSLYPVDGAIKYCFKAGNWAPVSSIPEGGFGQEGACSEAIQYCAPTATPTNTPETPTETPTNTPETPTETPTNTPETPTETPTNTPETPTETPTNTPETPSATPTPTNTGEPTPTVTSTPKTPPPSPTPTDRPPNTGALYSYAGNGPHSLQSANLGLSFADAYKNGNDWRWSGDAGLIPDHNLIAIHSTPWHQIRFSKGDWVVFNGEFYVAGEPVLLTKADFWLFDYGDLAIVTCTGYVDRVWTLRLVVPLTKPTSLLENIS